MTTPDVSADQAKQPDIPARNLAHRFTMTAQQYADQVAFSYPTSGGGWHSLTWSEVQQQAHHWAAGLLALGLQPEDRVAIAANTRLEWVLADLAVILAGGATTTVYPNTRTEDVAFIISDSSSVIAFAEDAEQLAKLRQSRKDLPQLRNVVLIDGAVAPDTNDDRWIITLGELEERGRDHLRLDPAAVETAGNGITASHLATLIYTSGTTGQPKGVELTHGNWVYLGRAVEAAQVVNAETLQFLWLPLSHVFGKLLLAAQYHVGFSTAIDGRIDKIADNMAEVRPTLMAAAPRIFEKVHARVTSKVAEEGGIKAKLFHWAIGVGLAVVDLEQAGDPVPTGLRLKRSVADRLVFAQVRARLGGRMKVLISGSAPLASEIARWFAAVGLPICEGYGMTEGSGATSVNRPGAVKIGSVGIPLIETQIRIADDGEIWVRSPAVMRGYHHLAASTAEVLTDGWLATGDVGHVDADGYLFITDRKKDLVKTSGGKYIAPSLIEGSIKAAHPMIAQAIVIADSRHFPSALIALDAESLTAWCEHHRVPLSEGPQHPDIHAGIRAAIDGVNQRLNHWEQVKEFRVLPRELDVESGGLTPSMKVKRAVVQREYADIIADIYSS